mgnify:CR=1 FL=1
MSNWDAYCTYFTDGLLGGNAGAIVSSIFIVGLCIFGLVLARRMFSQI